MSYLKATPSNLLNWRNSWNKRKCLNLGPKMPYFRIFGVEFWKAIFVIGINTLKLGKFQNFAKEENYLNLRKKMPSFGIFGPEFWKASLLFTISARCQLAKFCKKANLLKFKNKSVLFGYFWRRISKKLLSYLKSRHPN